MAKINNTYYQSTVEAIREELEHANHDLMEAQNTIQEAQELLDDIEEAHEEHIKAGAEWVKWDSIAKERHEEYGSSEPGQLGYHSVRASIMRRDDNIRPMLVTQDTQLNKTWDLFKLTKELAALIEYPAEIFRECKENAANQLRAEEKTYNNMKERLYSKYGKLN